MINLRESLEQQVEINQSIQDRWEILIGFGCGYFKSAGLDGDNVAIEYELGRYHGGGYNYDIIPIEFFEIESDKEAKEKYKQYKEEKP